MRSASPLSTGADRAGNGAGEPGAPRRKGRARNPLRFVRFSLLGLFVIVAGALTYALVERARQPAAPPLEMLTTDEGVSQRAVNLEATRTRRGMPSLKVQAKEANTYEDGRTELHDVAVTIFGESQGSTQVFAPLAVSQGESAGAWSFRNGVEVRTESGFNLRVPELKYRESPPEVSATGEVAFERGSISGTAVGLRYLVGRRRLDLLSDVKVTDGSDGSSLSTIHADSATFEPDVSRVVFHRYQAGSDEGQSLSGEELRLLFEEQAGASRIKKLEASGGFTGAAAGKKSNGAHGFLGSGAGSIAGDSMEIAFAAGGKPDEIRMEGSVKARMVDSDGAGRNLAAERLRIEFDAMGRANRIRAEERASLDAPGSEPGGAGRGVLRAEVIDSAIDPNSGALSSMKATGDASIEDGPRRLRAPTIRYESSSTMWFLDGQEGAPARAAGYGMTISSKKIEINRVEQRLNAFGDVKTSVEPQDKKPGAGSAPPAPPATPEDAPPGTFFGGEGPVHGMSDSLQVNDSGKKAFYRGKVRLWREGTSIEAAELDVDQSTGAIEARGGVVARIPAKKAEGAGTQTITISSNRMLYDRTLQKATFTGSTKSVAGDMRTESDSLVVSAGPGGGVKELTAKGSVKLTQMARTGTCDELFVDIPAEKYILYGRGRLAIIQDKSSQQVAKGTVLTFEGATDKILVESETGGRTWITLAPRPGMGKKSDPEPPR